MPLGCWLTTASSATSSGISMSACASASRSAASRSSPAKMSRSVAWAGSQSDTATETSAAATRRSGRGRERDFERDRMARTVFRRKVNGGGAGRDRRKLVDLRRLRQHQDRARLRDHLAGDRDDGLDDSIVNVAAILDDEPRALVRALRLPANR